ncbi:hypothetical protein BUALT_Bualt09G0067200 [Buddleja alternifolia]|uniref:Uncharacterized protein n=1 Tax=Buddleja alternifolia TaxID=168488 RepID=A0AAV6X1Y5_9LAMI|nr:hypothetical protein BUALT_Bualt09G0067200 [Buddleja alternifolia]
MSWIRSAVNKAVEAGGNSNLTRAVRSYADTVVNSAGQAVVGGAKLFQDRIGARNFQSYKLAVKRLEEVSVSCRGVERVQLLRRWLVALKEIDRLNEAVNTEHLDMSTELHDSPTKPTVAMYYDPDVGGEPMNFHDVFLRSQALEGITLSMILEEPNEEELSLLLEIFRLCLMGGKEAYNVTLNSVKDLARTFSTYDEEVLAKREELLQCAQDAIAGLKVNAEILRIDSEVSSIHKKLDEMKNKLPISESSKEFPETPSAVDMKNKLPLSEGRKELSEMASPVPTEDPNQTLDCIRLCSRLEKLLLRKKLIKTGDSPTAHNNKVDKLKILSESLASSASKAEKRISENKTQKEEALKFRVAKTSEVSLLEKELVAEIECLEKRKVELEAELKKVTIALTSTHARLHNAREERDQFDEASNEIIQHFKLKEDELSKSIATYRAEAEVCNTFVNFLENTWIFQCSYAAQRDKLVDDELESNEEYFGDLAITLLASYKEEFGPLISSIRELVENMKRLDGTASTKEKFDAVTSRRSLEEQYKTLETKLITTFSVAESIKEQFDTHQNKDSRKSDGRVKELSDALAMMKEEFESIERPSIEFETPILREETPSKTRTPRNIPFLSPRHPAKEKMESNPESTSGNEAQRGVSLPFNPIITLPLIRNQTTTEKPDSKRLDHLDSLGINSNKQSSDAEAQLSKLKMELELENHSRGNSIDGITDWEFDEKFDKEPKHSV